MAETAGNVRSCVDWEQFLSRHDLLWDTVPRNYGEAPFLGNGQLGSILYYDKAEQALKLEVFRADVHDHRDSSHGWTAYSRPRFVIGWFLIHLRGTPETCSLRLDLWNARVCGSIGTSAGVLSIDHYIHATEDFMVVHCSGDSLERAEWTWHPGEAKTTRTGVPYTQADIEAFAERYGDHYRKSLRLYQPNPPVRIESNGGTTVSVQDLLAGGQYVTAWRDIPTGRNETTTAITIEHTFPDDTARDMAVARLESIDAAAFEGYQAQHRNWWHSYYQSSFLSIPDHRLESFYWIQIYKLACATRADRPVMDTSGPWFQPTPWPYITTDLNLQLCYWPVCASNRLDLGQSLVRAMKECTGTLIENVRPEEWQADSAYMNITSAQDFVGPRNDDMRYFQCMGNLLWTLHNVWMIYRYSMDDRILSEVLLPLLERAVNLYIHIMYERDGALHLDATYSPEYPENPTEDCNYDLALFRWGCTALLDGYERLGIEHKKKRTWQDIVDRLTDYPIDQNGIRIGKDIGFTKGHRHFSHLLMIYPIYDLNVERDGVAETVRRSVSHWISSGALAGYSFTGASSLSSAIGDGNAALEYLKGLEPYILPNTLYVEAGPCMETPLAAAQSIHDMLLQSWGGILRIFPAVSDSWSDVVFHRLRAEGGFLVSACRKDGETVWVHIENTAGERCTVKTDMQEPSCLVDGQPFMLDRPDLFEIDIPNGGAAVIRAEGYDGSLDVLPLLTSTSNGHGFGVSGE